jgi:hypothetical protein
MVRRNALATAAGEGAQIYHPLGIGTGASYCASRRLSSRRAIRSRRLIWANRLAMAEWLRLISSAISATVLPDAFSASKKPSSASLQLILPSDNVTTASKPLIGSA